MLALSDGKCAGAGIREQPPDASHHDLHRRPHWLVEFRSNNTSTTGMLL